MLMTIMMLMVIKILILLNSRTLTFSSYCSQIEYSARNTKILRVLFVIPHQHFFSRQDGLE